jgi:hypothetical protein
MKQLSFTLTVLVCLLQVAYAAEEPQKTATVESAAFILSPNSREQLGWIRKGETVTVLEIVGEHAKIRYEVKDGDGKAVFYIRACPTARKALI